MSQPLFAIVGTVAATILVGAVVVGLRFLRRGLLRFHLWPALLCLALLPTAATLVLGASGLRAVAHGIAVVGMVGVAATTAGAAEALARLMPGLAATLLLSLLALLLLAAGRSHAPSAAGRAGTPVASLLTFLLAAIMVGGLVATQLVTAVLFLDRSATVARWPTVMLVVSLVLVLALPLLALLGALQAPRLRPGKVAIGLALAMPTLTAGSSALLLASTAYTSRCLTNVAITGDVDTCRLTRGAAPPLPESFAYTPPPPPPPPPAAWGAADERVAPELEEPAGGGVVGGVVGGPPKPTPEPASPVRVGGRIKEPKKLRHVAPVYPEIARQARVQGVVILEATISPQGHVTSVKVLRGIPLLDAAAVEAVRQWVYAPTLLNGVPVPVIMVVTVDFRLS